MTVWKIWHNAIPTFSILNLHHLRCEIFCPFCGASDDSVSHLFFQCNFARAVWFGLPISLKVNRLMQFHTWFKAWIKRWRKNPSRFYESWIFVLVGLDVIWRYRNNIVWRSSKVSLATAIRAILASVHSYIDVFINSKSIDLYSTNAVEFMAFSSHAHA